MEFDGHKSIFLQIADSILDKIMTGTYSSGDKLPSVREMAGEIGVNHNTIMRTFMELQNKGIIEQRRGIGNFVSRDATKIITEERKQEFFNKVLPEFKRQADLLGISLEELKTHLEK